MIDDVKITTFYAQTEYWWCQEESVSMNLIILCSIVVLCFQVVGSVNWWKQANDDKIFTFYFIIVYALSLLAVFSNFRCSPDEQHCRIHKQSCRTTKPYISKSDEIEINFMKFYGKEISHLHTFSSFEVVNSKIQ